MKFSHTLYKYYKKRIFCGLYQPHQDPLKKEYKYFFIIPAYKEKLYIEETLKSINNQNKTLLTETLVIIVINNSNDADDVIKKIIMILIIKLLSLIIILNLL